MLMRLLRSLPNLRDVADVNGETALMHGCKAGRADVVELLLQNGV